MSIGRVDFLICCQSGWKKWFWEKCVWSFGNIFSFSFSAQDLHFIIILNPSPRLLPLQNYVSFTRFTFHILLTAEKTVIKLIIL